MGRNCYLDAPHGFFRPVMYRHKSLFTSTPSALVALSRSFRNPLEYLPKMIELPMRAQNPILATSRLKEREVKTVAFCLQPHIRYFETPAAEPNRRPPKSRMKMESKLFQKFDRGHIMDDMLQDASELFVENYGVWSKEAAQIIGPSAKEGMVLAIFLQ